MFCFIPLLHLTHSQLLVIREDIMKKGKQKGMEQGKIAAQCCHAALGGYLMAQREAPDECRAWRRQGQAKICVKIPDLGALYVMLGWMDGWMSWL
jgi:peptidyl-tRNA hydrolase